jgi:hypothetical protein
MISLMVFYQSMNSQANVHIEAGMGFNFGPEAVAGIKAFAVYKSGEHNGYFGGIQLQSAFGFAVSYGALVGYKTKYVSLEYNYNILGGGYETKTRYSATHNVLLGLRTKYVGVKLGPTIAYRNKGSEFEEFTNSFPQLFGKKMNFELVFYPPARE